VVVFVLDNTSIHTNAAVGERRDARLAQGLGQSHENHVVGYTHAKQLGTGQTQGGPTDFLAEAWIGLIWQGRIEARRQAIAQTITSRRRRQELAL
jgi:hypothetical protein